jgi:hypothetical protein
VIEVNRLFDDFEKRANANGEWRERNWI